MSISNSPVLDDDNNRPNIEKSGLYDLQQVKRFIDDEVILFMESQGYEESTLCSNIKLTAGTIAVAAALYSHFGVNDFPACQPAVLACVITYIACSLLITLSSYFLEASATFVGQLTPPARRLAKGLPNRVWVHTTIVGRGSSTLRVQIRKSVRGKADPGHDSYGYERYFTTDGHFLKHLFTSDMKLTLDTVKLSKKTQ